MSPWRQAYVHDAKNETENAIQTKQAHAGPWCQSEEIRTEFNLMKQHLVNKFDV